MGFPFLSMLSVESILPHVYDSAVYGNGLLRGIVCSLHAIGRSASPSFVGEGKSSTTRMLVLLPKLKGEVSYMLGILWRVL